MVSREEIMEKLKEVIDPELGVDIVNLGLVYDVRLDGDTVEVKMTLTAVGCPLAYYFVDEVKKRLEEIEGIREAKVYIVFDPPWTPDRMSEEAKKRLGL